MDSVREGKGGKIWENGIETCKISCMKRVASLGSMHDTGCLGLVHEEDSGFKLKFLSMEAEVFKSITSLYSGSFILPKIAIIYYFIQD